METFFNTGMFFKVVILLTVWRREGECRQTDSLYFKVCNCLAKLLSYSRRSYFWQQQTVVLSVFRNFCCEMMSAKTFFKCLRKILPQAMMQNWGSRKIKEERKKKIQIQGRLGMGEKNSSSLSYDGWVQNKRAMGICSISEVRVLRHFTSIKFSDLQADFVSYLSLSGNGRTKLVWQVNLACHV